MSDEINVKLENLKAFFKKAGSVAIAFSSGVDSTFMLKVAHDVLGDKAIAVTVRSAAFPQREYSESIEFCKNNNIPHFICEIDEMKIPGFKENPKNRCYVCKKAIFSGIINLAKEKNIAYVCEGSNMDDTGDYRPGLMAIDELGVKSPLREAKLYKSEIRQLSKEMNLPTWNKMSFACLASRFPYGEEITSEKLKMVEKAEQLLSDKGFKQYRVRLHSKIARIEVLPEQFNLLLENSVFITEEYKRIGFEYVTMDLQGFRSGSMNEVLSADERESYARI